MLLLHHPYYFAFSFGSSLIVGLFGLFVDLFSIYIYKLTKTTLYLMSMDIIMVGISIFAYNADLTPTYWIINSFFYGIFLIGFSMNSFFESYNMLTKKMRILASILNALMFIGYICFILSIRGVVPDNLVPLVFLITLFTGPASFVYLYFMFKIVRVIKSNPGYLSDYKQNALVKIFKFTIRGISGIGIPFISIVILAGYFKNGLLLDLSLVFPPFMKLVMSMSNYFIMKNKTLEDITRPTGMSKFESQHIQ